jgi:hypothetical protein
MIFSDDFKELATALAKAQGEMDHAKRNQNNPHFKSSFADLSAVIDAIREPFAKNGLAYIQSPVTLIQGEVTIRTRIVHSSGQWTEGEISARPMKNDPQGIGSAITYLRRYGLMAMVGIAPADDDDGNNSSSGHHRDRQEPRRQQEQKPPQQQPAPKPKWAPSPDQLHALKNAADHNGWTSSEVSMMLSMDHRVEKASEIPSLAIYEAVLKSVSVPPVDLQVKRND